MERTFSPDKAPLEGAKTDSAKLDLIFQRLDQLVGYEGQAPNLFVHEFSLNAGIRHMINADFEPDRWIIYFKPVTDGELRVYFGDHAPGTQSIYLQTGMVVTVAHKNERIAFYNPSGSVNLTNVFAIAVGGGSEFSIQQIA